jgi:hypothetical protein
MLQSQVELPFHAPVLSGIRVAALAHSGMPAFVDHGDVQYLRHARMRDLGDSASRLLTKAALRRSYERRVKDHAEDLSLAFAPEPFDAMLSPPSRFQHALPYRCAFQRGGRVGLDLTDCLHRTPGIFSGDGAKLEDVASGLRIGHCPALGHCRSLLIVDDILWRGVTAVAWVLKLRETGLPEGARIYLASPLWIGYSH